MDKVYIVTKGEYSDYEIVGAFSTRDGAQKYIDNCGFTEIDCAEIGEFTLDSRSQNHISFIVEIWLDRNKGHDIIRVDYATDIYSESVHKVDSPRGDILRVFCQAKNHKEARLIAMGKRAEWLLAHDAY